MADLGASHAVFEVISSFPGRFVPVGACDVEPHVRKPGILEDTLPVGVTDPEVKLRSSGALLCSHSDQRTASASSLRTPGPRYLGSDAPRCVISAYNPAPSSICLYGLAPRQEFGAAAVLESALKFP